MNYHYSQKEDVFDKEMTDQEKEEKSLKPKLLDSLEFYKDDTFTDEQLAESDFHVKSAFSALYGRDVINTRGSIATPDFMEEQIREIAEGKPYVKEIHMIKGEELQKQGLSMIYNVGKAAISEPRLMTVHYKGNPNSDHTDFAIVGKGLTYDTGGLDLKPYPHMVDMYCDKGGAVATLGALKGVIDLKLPVNVAFAFGIAENAIDAKSYKPGDILKSLKGITVEVGNTDAEGRLVLGDTLTFTQRRYKPKYMVNLATLTGAILVGLGETTAGIFTNDEDFVKAYKKAGDAVFESHWHMPINQEHRESIKGDVGNICNTGKTRYGGSCTAAAFLENFVEKDTKWVHNDIAGPAYLDKPNFPMPSHGTGFGIQTLLRLLKDFKP